jgi:hypothetical protein
MYERGDKSDEQKSNRSNAPLSHDKDLFSTEALTNELLHLLAPYRVSRIRADDYGRARACSHNAEYFVAKSAPIAANE